MKKILIVFIVLLATLSSCEKPTVKNSIKHPKTFTTLAMQELPKDTLIVLIEDTKLSVFDEDKVVPQAEIMNSDVIEVPFFIFLILVVLIVESALGLVLSNY
ncbi:hypothetical protein KAU11_10555 [Candidatus Babeliales bacterium]|nr:hypothetical protein [Candidatus Babeliales bacterium]